MPERPKGAGWKPDGRSDAALGFESLSLRQNTEACRSQVKRRCLESRWAARPQRFESSRFRQTAFPLCSAAGSAPVSGTGGRLFDPGQRDQDCPRSSVNRARGYEPRGRRFDSFRGRQTRRDGRAVQGAFLLRRSPAQPGTRVRIPVSPPDFKASLAQLAERPPYKWEVGGSIPSGRTKSIKWQRSSIG